MHVSSLPIRLSGAFLRLTAVVALGTAALAGCGGGTTTTGTTGTTGGTGGTGGGGGGGGGSCGTSGAVGLDCYASIKVQSGTGKVNPNQLVPISAGTDPSVSQDFTVLNIGNTGLTIKSITIDYTPPNGTTEDVPAFSCVGPDGATACKDYKFATVQASGGSGTASEKFTITFTKPADQTPRDARVHIQTNDGSKPPVADFVIRFKSAAGVPKIQADSEVDMGSVKASQTGNGQFTIKNLGTADLQIGEIDATSLDAAFKLVVDQKEYPCGGPITLSPALVIGPGKSSEVSVLYAAPDNNPRVADLILKTNDPSLTNEGGQGWKRVTVKVNSTGQCLKIIPAEVDFGGVKVGSATPTSVILKSCGDEPVVVTDIGWGGKDAGPFVLDFAKLTATNGQAPTEAAPLTIAVNSQAEFQVVYTPTQIAAVGADGNPVRDSAVAIVTAPQTINSPVNVPISGFGSTGECPTPIIKVQEGDAVVPQTVLHLDGSNSYSSGGNIVSYKWTVDQPNGSVSKFEPTDTAKAPNFTPNVAGEYTFKLAVTDDQGHTSCAPAVKVVKVLPDQAIHVELVWHTPGDKDESDEGPNAGADLDLHFANAYAATSYDLDGDGLPDPWFADTYDCYWYNCGAGKTLEWGSYDPNIDDNPHLDRDDTDGAGPENLNLTIPEDGMVYSVGVYYFDDHGFGASTGTTSIYVYGNMQYQQAVTFNKHDLWYVATISWPDANIEGKVDANSKPIVMKNYPAPAL